VAGARRPTFLTAEWRSLALLNYRVAPGLLAPLVPSGTTLDAWHGITFLSVVGFLFRDTRVLGVPIPLHRHFEEINLRFYVRRTADGETRRGVVFVRELVPRAAIATVARLAYNEPYQTVAMRHRIAASPNDRPGSAPAAVEYGWRQPSGWGRLAVEPAGDGSVPDDDAEETFITEHYWGYTRQRDGSTIEYEVEHPRWRVWRAPRAVLEGDLEALYGREFAAALAGPPSSAFLAEGSKVRVRMPRPLPQI
jgi:uncharacterized protein